jgi:hypothetical protein
MDIGHWPERPLSHWPGNASQSLAERWISVIGREISIGHWPRDASQSLAGKCLSVIGREMDIGHWPRDFYQSLAEKWISAIGREMPLSHWPRDGSSTDNKSPPSKISPKRLLLNWLKPHTWPALYERTLQNSNCCCQKAHKRHSKRGGKKTLLASTFIHLPPAQHNSYSGHYGLPRAEGQFVSGRNEEEKKDSLLQANHLAWNRR